MAKTCKHLKLLTDDCTDSNSNSVTMEVQQETNHNNPILNEVIIMEIAKNLDMNSLKSFRLTCKVISKASFQTFESKSRVLLHFNEINRSISRFSRIFTIAFEEKRIFTSISIAKPCHLDTPILSNWMQKYGKEIIKLQLGHKTIPHEEEETCEYDEELFTSIQNVYNLIFEWCCKLKHLNILYPLLNQKNPKSLQKSQNLQSCIELTSLTVGSKNTIYVAIAESVEHMAFTICKWAKSVKSLILISPTNKHKLRDATGKFKLRNYCLSSLNVENYLVCPKALFEMSKVGFHSLKSLTLGLLNNSEPPGNVGLNSFLWSIGNNLQVLNLNLGMPGAIPASFPSEEKALPEVEVLALQKMKALKSLSVDIASWNVGSIGRLAQALSRLVELNISCSISNQPVYFTNFFRDDIPSIKTNNLKSLVIKTESLGLHKHVLKKIVSCFPNLKRIEARLLAFEYLDYLTNLELLEEIDLAFKPKPCSRQTLPKQIRKFKALKRLTLSAKETDQHRDSLDSMVSLDSDELASGILSLPTLENLKLTCFKLSEAAYRKLKQKPNGLKTRFLECVFVTN